MEDMIRRRVDRLVQILAFVTAHPAIFAASSLGQEKVKSLQELVAHLTALFATGSDGRTTVDEQTAERRKARASLLRSGRTIRSMGRLLALEGAASEVRFQVFRSRKDRDLLSDARALLPHLPPVKQALIDHGLSPKPADDLPGQIDALETAMQRQSTGRETHASARRTSIAAMKSAGGIVKALELILQNTANVDALTLEAWKSASRVGPSRAKAQKKAESTADKPSGTQVA
jgi:hypothetical protein